MVSVLFCKVIEKGYAYKQNTIGRNKEWQLITICCLLFVILLPALLAGLRNINIGTDTRLYIEPLFKQAVNSETFRDYYVSEWFYADGYSYATVGEYDLGYILVYVTALLTDNLNILFLYYIYLFLFR